LYTIKVRLFAERFLCTYKNSGILSCLCACTYNIHLYIYIRYAYCHQQYNTYIYIHTVWSVKSQQQVFSRNSENINFSSIHPSSARQYNSTHTHTHTHIPIYYIYEHYTAGIRPACTRYGGSGTFAYIVYDIIYFLR